MNEFDGLYNWTYRQRRLLWEYELSRDRKELLDAIGFEWGAPAIASASMVKEKASAETLQLKKELEEGNYHRKRKRTPVVVEVVNDTPTPESTKATKKRCKDTPENDSNHDNSDTDENISDGDQTATSTRKTQASPQSKKEQPVYVQMWLKKCAELKAYKKSFGTFICCPSIAANRIIESLMPFLQVRLLFIMATRRDEDCTTGLDGSDWRTKRKSYQKIEFGN